MTFGVAYVALGVQPNMLDKRDGHRARKRFGQHFLVDKAAIERIVSYILSSNNSLILKIERRISLTINYVLGQVRYDLIRNLTETLQMLTN